MDSARQQDQAGEQRVGSGRPPLYRASVRIVGAVLLFIVGRSLLYGEFVRFFQELGITLVFFLLAPLAWSLGDTFRRYAKPDWYFASGAINAAEKRFFWTYGPQLYGVGGVAAVALFLCLLIENPPEPKKSLGLASIPDPPAQVTEPEKAVVVDGASPSSPPTEEVALTKPASPSAPATAVPEYPVARKNEKRFSLPSYQDSPPVENRAASEPQSNPESTDQRASLPSYQETPSEADGAASQPMVASIERNKPLGPAKESAGAITPSFDCAKASSVQERLICSSRELAELDVETNNLYARARQSVEDKESLRQVQLGWLNHQRNVCNDVDCLRDAYESRITELSEEVNDSE